MDGAREYNAKQNKSVKERKIPYDFTHMWNLRNKTDKHRGREGKINKMKIKREANHKRLLTIGNKQSSWRGGYWVIDIKEGM